MARQKHCYECKSPIVAVHPSDLTEGSLRVNDLANTQAATILNFFIFYICPNCGLTLAYANSNGKKIAEELLEEQGGHS